jgi:Mn-dependent DtxR family transcriptional regulator
MNNRRQLSPKQDEVLRALVLLTHRNRKQPSYRELAAHVNVSQVHKYINELAAKGWIEVSNTPRGIGIPVDVYESIVDTGEVPND